MLKIMVSKSFFVSLCGLTETFYINGCSVLHITFIAEENGSTEY